MEGWREGGEKAWFGVFLTNAKRRQKEDGGRGMGGGGSGFFLNLAS